MSFLAHTACEKCGSSDAKATYKDGSAYCFSCRWSFPATISPYVNEKKSSSSFLPIPSDSCCEYPEHVLNWVFKYDIKVEELVKHNVVYSKERDQLIFQWDGLWQARNFRPTSKVKCFTQGKPEESLPTYGAVPPTLVLVEDPISAMKVGRYSTSSPVLGSSISLSKINRIASSLGPFLGLSKVVVWLDSDMWHKSVDIAGKFQTLGITAKAVYTEEDPKCQDPEVIKDMLDNT